MAKMDLIERSIGLESSGQAFELTGFGGAWPQVGVKPHRHEIVAARDVLNLENDSSFNTPARKLVGVKGPVARRLRLRGMQIDILDHPVGFPNLPCGKGTVGPGSQGITHRKSFVVSFK